MGVSNGQPVNAAVTNPAFLDADSDDTALGKISLNNIADPLVSGPAIINIQRELNALSSYTGKPINIAIGSTPPWVNNELGFPTDSLFSRVDTITQRFSGSLGHLHSGVNGDGPKIPGGNVSGVPLEGYFQQGTPLIGIAGSSVDVSTSMLGKVPSTSSSVLGVVVNTPYNKVILRETDGNEPKGPGGEIVYGRITESLGVWTLSFYIISAGIETSYSFPSAHDLNWYFQELFDPMTATPVYDPAAVTPSTNTTADVIDATETLAGKVILANVAPPEIDGTGAKGTSTRVAHQDHTHKGVHSLMIDGDPTQSFNDAVLKAGTGIALSWSSGKIQIDVLTLNTPHVETRTVTLGEAAAKSLTLSYTPNIASNVVVDFLGVGPQGYGVDYTVSGTTLDWNGLGMDSRPVEAGDILRIIYWS